MLSLHSIAARVMSKVLRTITQPRDWASYCHLLPGHMDFFLGVRGADASVFCLRGNRYSPDYRPGLLGLDPFLGFFSLPCVKLGVEKPYLETLGLIDGAGWSLEYCLGKKSHLVSGFSSRILMALRLWHHVYGYINGCRTRRMEVLPDPGILEKCPWALGRIQCDLLYSRYEFCMPCGYAGRACFGADMGNLYHDFVRTILSGCLSLYYEYEV